MRANVVRTTTRHVAALAVGLALAVPAVGAALAATAGGTTPSFTITTASPLPEATVGEAYGPVALQTQNGTGNDTWSWSQGNNSLAGGLTFDPSTGVITGTPTVAGAYYVTFTATDSSTPAKTTSSQLLLEVQETTPTTITTTSLPGGTLGGSYLASVTATGGVPPYFFFVESGGLPAGVSLNDLTGGITGSPVQVGPWSATICAEDQTVPTPQLSCQTYGGTVTPHLALALTPSLPSGVVGQPYAGSLGASGGTAPFTFGVTGGSLPPGLTLNSVTGQLTGTPTTAGSYTFTATVTDSTAPVPEQASGTFTVAVAAPPLTIVTGVTAGNALPNGVVNVSYTASLQASGGTTPYSWSVTGGSLPPGLALASSGAISGTPTMAGTYDFTAEVTDSSNPHQTATAAESITIVPGPLVLTAALPVGTVGQSYSGTLSAIGGVPPYSWVVSGGSLPPGLSLSTGGSITGTPTSAGTFPFTVTVTDSATPTHGTTTANLSVVVIAAGLSVVTTSASLPQGTVGQPYTGLLVATGGVGPYRWAVTGGSLPPGLSLSANGSITGTPTSAGTFPFTVTVTDSAPTPDTATANLDITVVTGSSGAVVTPTVAAATTGLSVVTGTSASNGLPGGQVGVPYTGILSATGGNPPYSWAVTGGSLPPGLSAATNGTISGTPTTAGTYSFTVTVTDSAGHSASQSESVTITPGVATKAAGSGGGANGYRMVGDDGGVFDFGGASFLGSLPGQAVHVSDIVDIQNTPDGGGYWLLGSDGGVFAFGDATFLGAVDGVALNERLVGMSAVPGGQGYRLVGADGGVFDFGTAAYQGSLPGDAIHLDDVVGLATTPDGNGYWLVSSDGGVYAFGDAAYQGSLPGDGITVGDIVAIVATPDGGGYWLVGADGGVFAFGDARYAGSMGGTPLNSPVTGMADTPDGQGYWLVAGDGGVFAFGDAPFDGSMGGVELNQPVHGIAASLPS